MTHNTNIDVAKQPEYLVYKKIKFINCLAFFEFFIKCPGLTYFMLYLTI